MHVGSISKHGNVFRGLVLRGWKIRWFNERLFVIVPRYYAAYTDRIKYVGWRAPCLRAFRHDRNFMWAMFSTGKNRPIDRTGCDDVSHASPCIRNFASEIPGDCSISSGLRVLTIHLSTLQRKLRTRLPNSISFWITFVVLLVYFIVDFLNRK